MAQEPPQPALSTDSAAWILLALPAAFFLGVTGIRRRHPFAGFAHYKAVAGQLVPDSITRVLLQVQPLALFSWGLFLLGMSCIVATIAREGPESALFTGGFFLSGAAGAFSSRVILRRQGELLG